VRKTLILHIGRGKTGTSRVQTFLAQNRDALRSQGVHFLQAGRTPHKGQKEFANTFINSPPPFMPIPADPDAVRAAVAAEISGSDAPNILLSSENFSGCDVPKLNAFFRGVLPTMSARIVFFARSQDELAESEYNQAVRAIGLTASFSEYIRSARELDFVEVLEPWADVFGRENIVARVYDASGRHVVEDFLQCLPLAELGAEFKLGSEEVANESPGFIATHILKALN
jgi:hypothetical protein